MSVRRVAVLLALSVAVALPARGQNYVNFEGSQTHPVRLSADGTRLFAVNTPDARLSVFDLSNPSSPALIAEIPVGIEPVSVAPRTNDEVWVVNQVSDSVSVVSVSQGIVVATIPVKDEPADVIFDAAGRAWVSVARSNRVRVFDPLTRALLADIPLFGENPRALALSADGTKVFAAFALSGNRTTIVPPPQAPLPPPPTNPNLPPAPREGLIVDATDPAWAPAVIRYTMPDNDVAEIDTSSWAVTRYFRRVGTVNLGLAVRPTNGDVYVANTNALNLVRFEPALRGHFVDNRLSRVTLGTGAVTAVDLNPGINYALLPNPGAKATALAQPADLVFEPGGGALWLAAFGTDRVARLDPNGNVLARVEIGPATGSSVDPRTKRGPRGLALNAAAQRLYVLNRISNTLSVVNTGTLAVAAEVPVGTFDPSPRAITQGRGFLYDAKLSGNGTASCASCHIDSDMDLLAWDLGNPGGNMQAVVSNGVTFQMHPMKGPMTTQTLRGLNTLQPFHWRGDRADFLAFNPAFDSLMGGSQISAPDMTAYRDFINPIAFMPNPNQLLNRTLPASFAGGDPIAGRNTYLNEPFVGNVTCNGCHTANPGPGSNRLIIPANALQEAQPFKVPQLRNIYQKLNFNNGVGAASISGFGLVHDGHDPSLFVFLSRPVFGNVSTNATKKNNLSAFIQCFDTGTAPAVGYTRTLTAANVNSAPVTNDWTTLEGQAAANNIALIAKGVLDGQLRGLLYRPATNDYRADETGIGPFTRAQLVHKVGAGGILSVMGVPPGSGTRMGIDRDVDGILDGDE